MKLSPLAMILIGFVCVLAGVVFPFLMVLHILESTFFLNFLSYTLSLIGLILGIVGSASYVKLKRKQ